MLRRLLFILSKLNKGLTVLQTRIRAFDKRMRARYNPVRLTLVTLAVMAVTMILTLFVPPYMGLSNDGSLDSVMADVGLARVNPDNDDAYFNYYERTYLIAPNGAAPNTTPTLLKATVRLAIWLDELFTGQDGLFDIRFLAAIYMMLYLTALYPLLRGVLRRVRVYSEGLVLAVFSALVFGDTTIVVRFASLYTQPWELILYIVLADAVFLIPWNRDAWLPQLSIIAAATALMTINPYCSLAMMVLSAAYWLMLRRNTDSVHRVVCLASALVMCFVSVVGIGDMLSRQTQMEKYNQMTRGVLFQAENPDDALAFFGIEPRYSVLTETYAEQSFPVANVAAGVLDEGFLDRYETADVVLYYLSHPLELVGIFDVGVHSAFITRSDYSGNYEQSVGLPPRAKALLVSLWSTFKEQSAPKTAGLVLLLGVAFIFFRRGKSDDTDEGEAEKMFTMLCVLLSLYSVVQLITLLVMSGDSMLVRQSFLMSVYIDVMFVLFLSEVLHKLKIIDIDEE